MIDINITLIIFDNGQLQKFTYKGNFALETMLIKITEKFFGEKVRIEFEYLLKKRIDVNGDLNND